MKDSLPYTWTRRRLDEVASITMGQAPPSATVSDNVHGGIPFLQGNAEFGFRFPLPRKSCLQPGKLAQQGDILISVRAPVGALNIAPTPLCIGRGLAAVTVRAADARFAWYALSVAVEELKRVSQGSTFGAVNREDLCRILLPMPSLGEQRKIAAILSSVDDAIEATQRVIDQLAVVKQAMMEELLTRGIPGRHARFKKTAVGEIPERWQVAAIADLGIVVTGATPSTSKAELWGGTVPFVTPGDLGRRRLVSRAKRTLTERGKQCSRALPRGAVLVTCIGATIGKCGVAADEVCTNQQINAVIPNPHVDSGFLYYSTVLAKPRLMAASSQTAVPIISKSKFEKITVAVPPFEEQVDIGHALTHVGDATEANVAQVEALQRLKDALLSVLLTGEVRVTTQEVAS